LLFVKEFLTAKGHKKVFDDPLYAELTPLDCLTLDFCLWVACCVKQLDIALELDVEWQGVKLQNDDMKLFKCATACAFSPGYHDFVI
jgi:hypothetical protein